MSIHDMPVETVPLDQIQPMPGNPRIGNRPMLVGSLTEHGQYRPVLAQRSSGHIIAGNNTWHAAKEHGATEIAVQWLDVGDERARKINMMDNRASDKATYDDRLLLEFLEELPDLDGTGYEPGDLTELSELLDNQDTGLGDDEYGAGGGDSTADEHDDTQHGEAVELWGATVGNPDIMPNPRSVWRLGVHHLVVADVNAEHHLYTPLLAEGSLLYPYPSLLVPYTNKTAKHHVVMVQPSEYLAGWLLTKWNRLRPDEQAVEVTE